MHSRCIKRVSDTESRSEKDCAFWVARLSAAEDAAPSVWLCTTQPLFAWRLRRLAHTRHCSASDLICIITCIKSVQCNDCSALRRRCSLDASGASLTLVTARLLIRFASSHVSKVCSTTTAVHYAAAVRSAPPAPRSHSSLLGS